MFEGLEGVMVFAVPIVGTIAVFTFVAIVVWAEHRRKEREAYYRYEMGKKLVEKGGISEETLLEILHGEDRKSLAKRKEGLKLGALVTMGVGVGLLVGLRFIEDESVWMVGWIPFAIGVALLVYALVLAPKDGGDQEAGG